ncbi:MAG: chromate transporter [Brevinematales bacterium]|nr:chromate transporter [Brevinematales bacterium]
MYIDLFFTFLKLGCITFGGGYAMIPVLERELIKKRNWATMEEIMDYYTIAQVTPGIIAINVSTFIGFKLKGFLGGIISTTAFIIPGISFVTIIAVALQNFADYPIIKNAFAGIRIAVGVLIIDTVYKLLKGSLKDKKSIVIFILAFLFSAVLSANPALIVIAAGLAGFFIYYPKEKKI